MSALAMMMQNKRPMNVLPYNHGGGGGGGGISNDLPCMLQQIHKELLGYCRQESPPFEWTLLQTFLLLQEYPAGLGRLILLTELESKWRTCLQQGEHSEKLKQVVSCL